MPLYRSVIATYVTNPAPSPPAPPSVAGPQSTFVFQPGATNPPPGVYSTWASMVAALSVVPGPRQIIYDASIEQCHVPAGVWPLGQLVYLSSNSAGIGIDRLTFDDGASLTFNTLVVSFADLFSTSSSPVVNVPSGSSVSIVMDFSSMQTTGAPFLQLQGGSRNNILFITNNSLVGDGTHLTIGAISSSDLSIIGTTTSLLQDFATTGGGAISCLLDPTFFVGTPQAGGFSTVITADSNKVGYTPASLPAWSNNSPGSVALALDRIAAHVGPIP